MLTCLCDAFFGEVGIATVKVLEHCGCAVVFDERQTCCGQPPFNAGDWESSRKMAEHCIGVFKDAETVVVPSASCAAMVHEGYTMMKVEGAPRTFELSQFLLEELKVTEWSKLPSSNKAAFHRSCHGRMLRLGSSQEKVLALIQNLKLVPFEQSDQCCGFGGAFSVTHGSTSKGVGLEKLTQLKLTGCQEVVSGDMGCLMHLKGLATRNGIDLKFRHYAELLAEAL